MPVISMFYGIVIYMYWSDHMPPHFHAKYQGQEVMFTFDGEPINGSLPPRQMRQIKVWCELHTSELEGNWEVARENIPLFRIDPLK